MLINYTKTEYDEKIESLIDHDYGVTTIVLDLDDFENPEEGVSAQATYSLPNGVDSYDEYGTAVLWSVATHDADDNPIPEGSRVYRGCSVPSVLSFSDENGEVRCSFSLSSVNVGQVKISFELDFSEYDGTNIPDELNSFLNGLHNLMFISNDGCGLTPDNSVVVPDLNTFFVQVKGNEAISISLEGKTKVLSFGVENDCQEPKCKCFEIFYKSSEGVGDEVIYDGNYYYTSGGKIKLRPLMMGAFTTMIGFTPEEMEIIEANEDPVLKAAFDTAATNNPGNFNSDVTTCTLGCLFLEEGKVYPVSSGLTLKSDVIINGNGSTIMLADSTTDDKVLFSNTNYLGLGQRYGVSDVTFENIRFKGNVWLDQGVIRGHQCFFVSVNGDTFKNFTFENVTFDGFKFDIHTTDEPDEKPYLGWKFNNCEFVNSANPFMLNWADGVTVTNSHLSNTFSQGKMEHCFYIGGGCSNIVVDNCLLENSMGGAIHQNYDGSVSDDVYICNNRFTNLQIRNCNTAVMIGSPSRDALVENVFATNAMRGLHLENCTGVIVNNFNSSDAFSNVYIRKNELDETLFYGSLVSQWNAISIVGTVVATINNSHFSSGGKLFYCSEYHKNPSTFNNRVILVGVEINNSSFVVSNSDFTTSAGVKVGSTTNTLGVNKFTQTENSTEFYYYNMSFNKCKFYINLDFSESALFRLEGTSPHKSLYSFNECLIAYKYDDMYTDVKLNYYNTIKESLTDYLKERLGESYNEDDDAKLINLAPSAEKTMPKGYFITFNDDEDNASATISNCVFYTNLDNEKYSNQKKFVADAFSTRVINEDHGSLKRF